MTHTYTPQEAQPQRRRELDAMGALVVVGLIFFHSARIFDEGQFYVKNEPTSELVMIILAFAVPWAMPLMFFMAGIAICYSLRKRSAGQFVLERTRRILVPLLFGVLLLIPPQVWLRLRGDPGYAESYWEFYPRFFDVVFNPGNFPFIISDAPGTKLFETGQLWFLVCLFAFSLVLLPLLLYLRGPGGRRWVERLAGFCQRRWAIFALALPPALVDAALKSEEGLAAWNRYSYAVFLFYGFLVASDRRFGLALQRHYKSALVLGLLVCLVAFAIFGVLSEEEDSAPMLDKDPGSRAFRFLKSVSGWLLVVGIVGFASRPRQKAVPAQRTEPRQPTRADRVASYASRAQLPIYVLHQTVIVAIGFYVVRWELNAMLKYGIISLSSLATTLLVYDVCVRRTRVTRFLFGIKA